MSINIPEWALRKAEHKDRETVKKHYAKSTIRIEWPEAAALRYWAKNHGWPGSRLSFRERFMKKLLENEQSFAFGLTSSGVRIFVPVERYSVSAKELRELDRLYESRDKDGRPDSWNALVEGLREIRRAVDAGVEVEVEGKTLKRPGSFYTWAHGRYHGLEDGCDKWIGDDN